MPTCAQCGKTADDPTGWARAQITHVHYVSSDTVTGDASVTVLDFDTDACRDAWTARSGPAG